MAAQIRARFAICGISDTALQAGNPAEEFIISSGIDDPDRLHKFKPEQVENMVKAHNRRIPDLYVSTAAEKNVGVLIYYAKYCWRRNIPINQGAAVWNENTMELIENLMAQVEGRKKLKTGDDMDPGPIDIGAGYRDWVERFRHKLMSTIGMADVPLAYVVRSPTVGPDPNNPLEVDLFAMRLDGPEYIQDNAAVYTLLYKCCNHAEARGRCEALTWIDPFKGTQNGRGAYLAFMEHFEGEGPNSTRKAEAHAQIRSLHWKSESAMPFTTFSSHLKDAYDIVSKDAPYADEFKVKTLIEKIKPTSEVMKMEVAIGHVQTSFASDFNGAITYLTGRVADIYADEIAKVNKYGGKRNRNAFEMTVQRAQATTTNTNGRGGRGGGARDNRGGGNRGGRGGRGRGPRGQGRNRQKAMFNGVDVTDIDRKFTDSEWDKMGPGGRAYVHGQRERRNEWNAGRNGGRGNAGRGRNNNQGGRNIVSELNSTGTPSDDNNGTHNNSVHFGPDTVITNDQHPSARGGRSGAAFGRGAHGNH